MSNAAPISNRRRVTVLKASPRGRSLAARRDLNAALRELEPRVARAFAAAVERLRNQPRLLRDLVDAVASGSPERVEALTGVAGLGDALRGSGLSPGAATFHDELMTALAAGGSAGQRQLGRAAARISASLDLTNPEAVRYLRETLPTLIREITEDSRGAVRQALLRGFNEGRPAPLIAREIRDSVGLTESMERAVSNLRRQLETGELGAGKHPATRRLSATEQRQAGRMFADAATGSPASQARIDAVVDRYRESLVNRRAKNIARTEVHRAFVEGQGELWRQAEERGLLDRSRTRRVWIYTRDDRVRDDHAAVPGMNPNGVGLDEPFQTPVGPAMGPGQSGDAGFNVNCRCSVALEIRELGV